MRFILPIAVLLTCLGPSGVLAQEGQEKDRAEPAKAKSDPSLAEMRDLMERTRIEVFATEGDDPREAKFHDSALFRYSDEPKFIKDSTLWIWTDRGRPTAIQKIENNFFSPTSPTWTYCYASLSEELVRATWPNAPAFETSKPGVVFAAVADAPKPGKDPSAWDRQLREIARGFSIKSFHQPDKFRETFRLLPRPIYEYESKEQGILRGKIFGMASGTNPDALLIVELHQNKDDPPQWRYAGVQMTSVGVSLFHKDKKVWTGDHQPRAGRFETWTYMFLPRSRPPASR
jgi:hypothetical protein